MTTFSYLCRLLPLCTHPFIRWSRRKNIIQLKCPYLFAPIAICNDSIFINTDYSYVTLCNVAGTVHIKDHDFFVLLQGAIKNNIHLQDRLSRSFVLIVMYGTIVCKW